MKKFNKISGFLFILVGILAVSGLLIKVGMNNQHLYQLSNKQASTVHYVLVNEDLGTKYQNKTLNLGKNFINLVNQDHQHSWQVASQNVAEAGFKNGTYDVEIILPQNFSQRLLNLESMNPQKAQITYKVKKGASEKTNRLVQAKIGTIINSFNQKIIKMYFSSVLANLSEAQRNVSGITAGNQTAQTALTNQIQTPFKTLPTSLTEIVTAAQGLNDQNADWQTQQTDFTKATQTMLQANSAAAESTAEDLAKYVMLQNKIGELNLNHADALVAKQSTTDTKVYQDFYQQYNDVRLVNFDQLASQDTAGNQSGLLVNMAEVGQAFSEAQQKRMTDLEAQIAALTQQKAHLELLKTQTETHYFNGKDPSQGAVTDADIRESVKKIMQPVDSPSKLPMADYLNADDIKKQVAGLDGQLPALIEQLLAAKLISQAQHDQLQAEYEIVKRYAETDLGQAMPTSDSKLIWLNTTNPVAPEQTKATVENTVKVMTNQESTITVTATNQQQLALALTTEELAALNQQLAPYQGVATLEGQAIKIRFKTPREASTKIPESIILKLKLPVTWTFNDADNKTAYRTLNYQVVYQDSDAANNQVQKGTLSCFVNDTLKTQALQSDFGAITANFDTLANLSQRLVTIFGTTQQLTPTTFNAWLKQQNAQTKMSALASPDSVYNKYDYLSQDTIADYYVKQYGQQGHLVWNEVTHLIADLDAVLNNDDGTSLNATLTSMAGTPEVLNEQQQKLTSWYRQSNSALESAYQQWQDNPQLTTSRQQYQEGTHDDISEFYFDDGTGDSLADAFQELNTSTKQEVESTSTGATKIGNLTDQFKTLVKTTTATNADANQVLKNTNQLVSSSAKTQAANRKYAADFNSVLQNTHTGGADNQNVFNFLANPLIKKGASQTTAQNTSAIPYLMTVLSVIMTLLLAISYAKKTTIQNSWRLVGYLTVTSLLASLVVVNATFGVSDAYSRSSWSLYTAGVNLISVLVTYFCWRLFPKVAPYLFGILIGGYLMLTPILGINIQTKSVLFWLFIGSPLQNLENGYRQLLTKPLTIAQLLILLLLLAMVSLCVLIICLKDRKEVQRGQQTLAD
ncbi:type VII secretion protein EsaA [Latilactobacillus fuchuensis]|uniref:type VII secretion protein EsaA n=1 Tax=Latilactobacillus fuchuensis TaxID=164393 RepID=UPI0039AE985D